MDRAIQINRQALKVIKSAMKACDVQDGKKSAFLSNISLEEGTAEQTEEIIIYCVYKLICSAGPPKIDDADIGTTTIVGEARETITSHIIPDSDIMEVDEQQKRTSDLGMGSNSSQSLLKACGKQSDKPSSLLLNCPGEIRNKIWRYLLLTNYARELDPKRNLVISASILSTCRQIYQETSSILWRENHWIVVSETWRGIVPSSLRSRGGLPFRFLDDPNQLEAPALAVAISFGSTSPAPEFRRTYAFAYDRYFLVQICIGFWKHASKYAAEASLSLMPHVKETQATMQALLLQPFTMLRGVKKAIINGAASIEAGRFLKSIMETRVTTYQEVIKIIQFYKNRGDEALLNGDFRTALRIYYLGLRTATDAKRIAGDNKLGGQNMNSTFSLLKITSATFSNTAFAFYMVGDYKTAISQVGTTLGFAGISEESRALAHYRRGLAYAASNQDLLAAKDFCYAKDLKPGYPGVAEHITALEGRLGFRLADDFAPLLTLEFPDVETKVWRGDPRLVDGPDGWGRTGWNMHLMAMGLTSQGRVHELEQWSDT